MGQFRDSPGDRDPRNQRSIDRSSNARDSNARRRAASAKAAEFQQQQAAARQIAGQQDAGMMEAEAAAAERGGRVGGAVGGSLFGAPGALAGNYFGGLFGGGLGREVYGGASPQSLVNPGQPQQNRFGGTINQQYGGRDDRGNNMGMLAQGYGGGDNRSPGQIEMDRQDQFLQYAGGMYHPGMQRGEEASQALFDYYSGNPQAMQEQVNQSVMDSPFLAQNIALGEDAVARNAQATGGFRSGTTNQNLAQNSQNVYQNLYNQQLQQNLQGLGGFSDQGANQLNQYSNFGRGMINDIGTTSGNIQSQNIARDANDQNFLSGIIGGVASGIGSYFGS